MGTNLLTLSVDIPWVRLCVTDDMIDTTLLGDQVLMPCMSAAAQERSADL
jgi:hypothetical protein